MEKSSHSSPSPEFESGWQDVMKLSIDFFETFGDLPQLIEKNLNDWKEWIGTDSPETIPLPSGLSKRIKPFEVSIFIHSLISLPFLIGHL